MGSACLLPRPADWCSTPPRASRSRPASSSRSAGCATCRSSLSSTSSPARAATRSPVGRDRAVVGARCHPGLLADQHEARLFSTYDLFADALLLFERGVYDQAAEPVRCSGLDDAKLPRLLRTEALAKLSGIVSMLGSSIFIRGLLARDRRAEAVPTFRRACGLSRWHRVVQTSRCMRPQASAFSCHVRLATNSLWYSRRNRGQEMLARTR